jgi:DedD protein
VPKAESPPETATPPKAAKPKAPAKTAAKTAKPAPKAAGGMFVIQVIALADAEKAQRMQERIAAAGIKSYTEVVKTVKGDVTRVRAGPFATREAAEKAQVQLKSLGMNGNITTR